MEEHRPVHDLSEQKWSKATKELFYLVVLYVLPEGCKRGSTLGLRCHEEDLGTLDRTGDYGLCKGYAKASEQFHQPLIKVRVEVSLVEIWQADQEWILVDVASQQARQVGYGTTVETSYALVLVDVSDHLTLVGDEGRGLPLDFDRVDWVF